MELGDVIRFLRQVKRMTQKELADRLAISPSTIGMYEQNRRVPDIDTVSKIANVFDVSMDELVGTKKIGGNGNCDNYFYEEGLANWEIRKKAAELNLSYEDILDRTGIDSERFNLLWFGNVQPYAEELIRFSEVLNVSIDYLLDNSQRERVSVDEEIILRYYKTYPDEIMDLLGSFTSLSRKNRTIVSGKCFELEHKESVAADETEELRMAK